MKVALIVVLQLGSASVATMALGRSAYLTGVPMNPGHYDELAEDTPAARVAERPRAFRTWTEARAARPGGVPQRASRSMFVMRTVESRRPARPSSPPHG